jgi:hypothetical protein
LPDPEPRSNGSGPITHKIVQNRLALGGEESVCVGHRRYPPPGQSGEPTMASISSAMTESRYAARRQPQSMRARPPSRRTRNCTPPRSAADGYWHCGMRDQHHWRCGTGIGPDRDIITRWRHIAASCPSLPTALAAPARNTGGKARLLDSDRRIPARDQTVCWREMDSNLQYRAVKGKFVPSASGSSRLESRM